MNNKVQKQSIFVYNKNISTIGTSIQATKLIWEF